MSYDVNTKQIHEMSTKGAGATMDYSYAHDANMKMFEKLIERQKQQLLAALDEALKPLLEQGKRAYDEYAAAEKKLKTNVFSDN